MVSILFDGLHVVTVPKKSAVNTLLTRMNSTCIIIIIIFCCSDNMCFNLLCLYFANLFRCNHRYTEDMELDDAVHTAILTLKEG